MAGMKPITMKEDTVERLWQMYHEKFPQLLDVERSFQTFRDSLFDRYTQIFEGPSGIVFVFRDMYLPNGNASMYLLIPEDAAWSSEDVRDGVKRVMDLFEIHRLFSVTPSEEIGKVLKSIGFIQEGTLREAYLVDGERSDVGVYSILRHEVEDSSEAERAERISTLVEAAK